MRRVVIYGVGSPLVIDVEEACARGGIEIAAGVRNVDGPAYVSDRVRVVAPAEVDELIRRCSVVFGLFTPGHRKTAFEEALRHGFAGATTIVDASSSVARSADLGDGVFVNAGCVIAGGSRLGNLVCVNRSASIGHHAQIDAYASIGPGAVLSGMVTVGRGAVIGAGSVVLPEVAIGENAVIGAGSVVRKSVPSRVLAEGNPCRIKRVEIAGYKGLLI